MAFSRDYRLDRRRRVLRDSIGAEGLVDPGQSQSNLGQDPKESSTNRRPASYSHSVRQACNVRLVQLIPVRWLSYLAVVFSTIVITAALLSAHYLIYVSGTLNWYGHPLAIAFDATHPQGLAAWLGSHLWLLCLASTLLIFQLRRHKLDDYNGEYRLWFWLVLACLLASIDSTTHLSDLLAYSLDHWSKVKLGWSGRAVVQATLAALVGILGLRLCTELKTVPLSLICWLLGLVAWAGSSMLSSEIFRFDVTVQMRFWLRAALWLGGLASIWISSLTYLRHVYMEAQQRFLLRGKQSSRIGSFPAQQWLRPPLSFKPKQADTGSSVPSAIVGGKPSKPFKDSNGNNSSTLQETAAAKRWSLQQWFGSSLSEDDAEEYKKIQPRHASASESPIDKTQTRSDRESLRAEKAAERAARRAAAQAERQAKRESRKLTTQTASRLWQKPFRWLLSVPLMIKLPSLSGLRLNPPGADENRSASQTSSGSTPVLRPIASDRPLPTTVREDSDSNGQSSGDRQLSKAERRRLRRQDRAA